MKKFKIKDYVLLSIISLFIFSIIYYIKGIFPFGNNSLIWGDMHDQVLAFYFNFYDAFTGSKSLLIDFNSAGGINFFGILAYYILSPVNFILFLAPRESIYQMTTIIISIKILLCSITCMYFLKKYFKNLPSYILTMLSLLYGFSSYGLIMYQITSWIDAMYMFPLVVIGLKKIYDLEKPNLYIITLALSLIFSFYVSIMSLLFVFLISFIYIITYKDKKDYKKIITVLGISTIISILIASFVIIPSYLEINSSYRVQFDLSSLLNSKTGPLTDKLSMLLFGGIIYTGIILLLIKFKKNLKFLMFYIPTILVLTIPIIIEPIHKMLHFGSFACFPYRFGYITVFFLILGGAYYFNQIELKDNNKKLNKILTIIITVISILTIAFIAYKYKLRFQKSIYKLSLSKDSKLIILLFIMFFFNFISSLVNIIFYNKYSKHLIVLTTIISIISLSYIYFGIDSKNKHLLEVYDNFKEINNYKFNDNKRVKLDVNSDNRITNAAIISNIYTFDHFTSLTNKNTIETLKKLGYTSYWVKTSSKGSNLFIDSVLGNQYLITDYSVKDDYKNNYELIHNYSLLDLYKLKYNLSYGYLLNYNDTVLDKDSSFDISNSLYKNINNTKDDLFIIDSDFTLDNIKKNKESDTYSYSKIDDKLYAYFIKDIDIKDTKTLYLELYRSLDNGKDQFSYKNLNIYINDKLYIQDAYNLEYNNVINLGTYTNQNVNIKIELESDVYFNNINLGIMDNNKYNNFIKKNYIDTKVTYNKNKINIKYNSKDKDKILFLPINYQKEFKATNNGKNIEILKVYDNFVGVKLNKGDNDINITYISSGLNKAIIISIIGILLLIIFNYKNIYEFIMNNKIINNVLYYGYILGYIGFILAYIILTVVFILSYFHYF